MSYRTPEPEIDQFSHWRNEVLRLRNDEKLASMLKIPVLAEMTREELDPGQPTPSLHVIFQQEEKADVTNVPSGAAYIQRQYFLCIVRVENYRSANSLEPASMAAGPVLGRLDELMIGKRPGPGFGPWEYASPPLSDRTQGYVLYAKRYSTTLVISTDHTIGRKPYLETA